MDAYFIGTLIGRLIAAYLITWLVCFLIARFRYKSSIGKLHSRWGLVAVLALFIAPLLLPTT